MSFDEENTKTTASASEGDKPKTFFGLQLSDGVVYTIVVILTLIFIRQVVVIFQALN